MKKGIVNAAIVAVGLLVTAAILAAGFFFSKSNPGAVSVTNNIETLTGEPTPTATILPTPTDELMQEWQQIDDEEITVKVEGVEEL